MRLGLKVASTKQIYQNVNTSSKTRTHLAKKQHKPGKQASCIVTDLPDLVTVVIYAANIEVCDGRPTKQECRQ